MSIKLWLASCSVSSKSLGFFFFIFFWQNCSLIINNFSCQSATSPICSFVEIDLSFCLPEEGGFRFIILIYLTQDSFYSRSPPPTHTIRWCVCGGWVVLQVRSLGTSEGLTALRLRWIALPHLPRSAEGLGCQCVGCEVVFQECSHKCLGADFGTFLEWGGGVTPQKLIRLNSFI